MFLGIDTSNYTTSLAICDANGVIVEEQKQILSVRSGERGLRQSEAVFQHVKNLPDLMEKLQTDPKTLQAIGVTTTPRPVENSYMPVFRAGEGMARSLAKMLNLPLVRFSHQENHIRAALYGCALDPEKVQFPIIATHFSGGTSELLLVHRSETGYDCQIVGQTLDLNAGQLVDRIGVAMGLSFPAGKALEQMALTAGGKAAPISSCVEDCDFHFSGQENQALALLKQGVPEGEVALGLLRSIAKTLEKAVRCAAKTYGVHTVLFSGGVMANGIIKDVLSHRLAKGFHLYFTKPAYATDQAAGVALLTRDQFTCRL